MRRATLLEMSLLSSCGDLPVGCQGQEAAGWARWLPGDLLLAGPTLDDPVSFLDGRLVHEHWVLRVTGVQQVLLLMLVGCG